MSTIVASHRTDQAKCLHKQRVFARLQCTDGREQIREVCEHCGKRDPHIEPQSAHPDHAAYPLIVDHPYPCDCHEGGGERHRRWEPVEYEAYLRSEQWAERRTYHLTRVFNRCQLCNARNDPANPLQAHHRTYVRLGAELDIDVIVLCRDCHVLFHSRLERAAA